MFAWTLSQLQWVRAGTFRSSVYLEKPTWMQQHLLRVQADIVFMRQVVEI